MFFCLRVFLVNYLMGVNFPLMALKISKSSLSGSILTNLQPSFCSITFYFNVNLSVAVSIFINFYCELIVIKKRVNPITWNFILCLYIYFFILTYYDCSFVKITSCFLNSNPFLNVWGDGVLQSIIILIANFSLMKILLTCFFGSSSSSYLWFYMILIIFCFNFSQDFKI